MDDLSAKARRVWRFVPDQPWSRAGNAPVPVEIAYSEHGWSVRFVKAVRGGKRVWAVAAGETLEAALDQAWLIQCAAE